MKYFLRSLLLLTSLSIAGNSHAQTVLYTEDFESSTPAWSLNTSDLGSSTAEDNNHWVINNMYAGGDIIIATIPDVPAESWHPASAMNSNYLHVSSIIAELLGVENACFLASSTDETYFASMSGSISTMGYDSVGISFHWLCNGDAAASYGLVLYRTSASGAWDTLSTPTLKHNLTSSWTLQQSSIAAFANKSYLQFAFLFRAGATGSDPSFAIDDITIVGGSLGGGPTPPVAHFTTDVDSVCADGCITATSTSTGTVDSFAWAATIIGLGTFPIPGNTPSVTVCGSDIPFTISAPTTIIVTLGVFNSGGADTESHPVVILPLPAPTISQAGNVLSTGTFSGYQWYMNGSMIPGAMASTYTISSDGYYQVLVTNAYGCSKMADSLHAIYTGISNISGGKDGIWMNERNGVATVHASGALSSNIPISVFDMTGRRVKQDLWPAGKMSHDIDLMDLPQGVYNIHLQDNKVLVTLRCTRE